MLNSFFPKTPTKVTAQFLINSSYFAVGNILLLPTVAFL